MDPNGQNDAPLVTMRT